MTAAIYITNLLDRGRFNGVAPIEWLAADAERTGAEIVVVDLSAAGAMELLTRLSATRGPEQRLYAFAGHVETDALDAASGLPGVEALPRSVFFRRLSSL